MAFYKFNTKTGALVKISDVPLSPGDDEAVSEIVGITKQVLESKYIWTNNQFELLPKVELTKREFLLRMTPDEFANIKIAANSNPHIEYFWQLFMLAEFIDLKHPDTIKGVHLLAHVELLTPSRVQEILGN